MPIGWHALETHREGGIGVHHPGMRVLHGVLFHRLDKAIGVPFYARFMQAIGT